MGPSDDSCREYAARVSVETLTDHDGICIDDRIERRRCELLTETAVTPEPADPDRFRYPVDVAVRFSTTGLTVTPQAATYVHGGSDVSEVQMFEVERFDGGAHSIEMTGPVKLYVDVDGPFEIENGVNQSEIRFPEPTTVSVGARSFHEQPAATVTTTDDPRDLMSAVSTFGSALKTTSSERSYPTLRGHPPALELGEALSIPGGLQPPDDEVRLEVPPTLASVFVVSPLAYYLGASVGPAAEPRLVVGDEAYPLPAGPDLETAVEQLLKRTFFLDCLVRTVGPRRIPLWERRELAPALEEELSVDLDELHGCSPAERLRAYQSVDYERIEPYLPDWKLVAHVQAAAANVETIPFLVSDLAVVRCARATGPGGPGDADLETATVGITDGGLRNDARPLYRSDTGGPRQADRHSVWAGRGGGRAVEETWVGDGIAPGMSKAMPEAFRNRLGRDPRERDVDIVVVCNDEEMLEERNVVRDVYGSRRDLPFDVTFYEGLTTDRLELVLGSDIDFFHYIGHVTEEGFECTDGVLDVSTLERVDVDVAFLNACRSYEQGVELIRKGAVAGVVTLDDVVNSGAVRIGSTMARLLNFGFPLRSALTVAKDRSIVGSQYLVVGDGNADISQAWGYVPLVAEAESIDPDTAAEAGGEPGPAVDGEPGPAVDGRTDADVAERTPASADRVPAAYRLSITTFPTRWAGMGTQFRPAIRDCEDVYLSPRTLPERVVSPEAFDEYLSTGHFPVILDGEFTWSEDVDPR